jgi:Domain of unknown function (DUF4124)
MKLIMWLMLPLLLGITVPTHADFYKYKDAQGHVRYTDDLSQVPVDQRSAVQSYVESAPAEPDKPAPPELDHTAVPENIPTHENGTDMTELRKRLEMQQEALNKEYDGLMQEKSELDSQKEKLKTTDDFKNYNQKVADFNEKINVWESKRKTYDADLESYNAKVKSKASQTGDVK